MDTLMSLRVFCTVSELKSFTAAADRLNLSPAMASKHVMHLEKRLSTRLLNRTSRHVSLTESGVLYFNQAKQMIDGLDEVESAVSNVSVVPRGRLRLSAPIWVANPEFVHLMAEFHDRYPDIQFDVDLSGRVVNLVDEGYDVALRVSKADRLDPGIIARPLSEVEFMLVASPGYLQRTGRPLNLGDLNGHSLLLYSYVPYHGGLTLDGPDGRETVKFNVVLESGNETLLYMAAVEGMGMTFIPRWLAEADVAAGRLELVLPNALRMGATLYAVYPSRKYLSAKVRTFIDFFSAYLQQFIRNSERRLMPQGPYHSLSGNVSSTEEQLISRAADTR
jgi:DNA-binding transcriptional LysR family regulator